MMIGDRIKQLRLDAKMTQPELAKKLDVTRSAVAAYENNTRQPSFQILIRLAHVFNVSTDYLLLGNDNNLLDVEGLSGEQRAIIVSLIKNFRETNDIIRFDTRLKRDLVIKNREMERQLKKEGIENKEYPD